jgi:hypothetical protein
MASKLGLMRAAKMMRLGHLKWRAREPGNIIVISSAGNSQRRRAGAAAVK